MNSRHVSQKNRIKNLEKSQKSIFNDAQRLYKIAHHYKALSDHRAIEGAFISRVSFLAVAFLSCVFGYIAVLHNVSTGG